MDTMREVKIQTPETRRRERPARVWPGRRVCPKRPASRGSARVTAPENGDAFIVVVLIAARFLSIVVRKWCRPVMEACRRSRDGSGSVGQLVFDQASPDDAGNIQLIEDHTPDVRFGGVAEPEPLEAETRDEGDAPSRPSAPNSAP